MTVRATWRRLATLTLIVGALVAVFSTRGILDGPMVLQDSSVRPALPAHLRPLTESVLAWQQTGAAERAEYVGWLVGGGLEARREALSRWIDARATQRGEQAATTLSTIFLALALASLLLVLRPLFVRREQAPHRVRLWVHSGLAATTLCGTLLLLMVGLSGLMMVTSALSQNANPEQGLIDAAFAEIKHDAQALLAADGGQADPLPYGPTIGLDEEGYDGGFLANLMRSLRYFDPAVFEPALAWTQRAWAVLGFLPFVIPFLVALVFLLTMRDTLRQLLRWPLEAGRGIQGSARRAFGVTLGFIARELLAIVLLVFVLLAVSVLVQVGVRLLSHQLVTLALAETRTTIEYFGRLTGAPAQGTLTVGILAPPAYLMLASLAAAGGLALFAFRARRRIQRRLHHGRSATPFWGGALLALFRLQWIPVLLLCVLMPALERQHAAPLTGADDALGRLVETAVVLAVTLPMAFFLFGGFGALRELLGLRRRGGEPDAAYALRPSTEADRAFLVRAHHEGLRPWIEAVWGWDDEAQGALVLAWLDRHAPEIVTIGGEDAGYLLAEEGEGTLHLHAVVLLPSFQRRGVGTRIVQDLIARATARGLPVTLQVLKPNPARTLYERLGFAVIEETPERFRMRRDCV